jgi:hypothetical protein
MHVSTTTGTMQSIFYRKTVKTGFCKIFVAGFMPLLTRQSNSG